MLVVEQKTKEKARTYEKIEIVGLILVIAAMLGLLFIPETVAGIFNAMVDGAYRAFSIFIFDGIVGIAIVVSIIVGRVLERLGFTDALIRIFVPIMKYIGVNCAVIIPSVYNIIGDSNAAGRIAGPILPKANATKDEQKIAIATMVQSQQSLATFMLGLTALTVLGIKVFPVILIMLFVPLIVVPLFLRLTIYRDTKSMELDSMPKFTPNTPALTTIFGAAKEGAELLFLLVIPAGAVILGIIGALDYLGIWGPVNGWISSALEYLSIHPETGILSIMVSPTMAMGQLLNTVQNASIDPKLAIGSFILAASCFPLQIIFGQIPAIWSQVTDLNESEAMKAAILGAVMRLVSTALIVYILTPLVI
ncbi:hypothetical protein [Candidatus Contubernalis alkaliaceticus]|uniref:hypothetical protein n=1 Tax=Candidatus Contubernalis alkaliaceticus TaxID=338645 RepID=UPI001F4C1566|nr:hypothetical protein [Candidatus Contubernalis alkalaceticus]UNC91553.1 hypothetical protein HUE98_05285 [Candidatus Contubernalis alkalaceticus]